MLANISSATLLGVDGRPVAVEVHVSGGLPGFTIVGLPDTSCREVRDRARAALMSSDLPWPATRKVTVNLAPSGVRKVGSGLDLAIAVGLLMAQGELPADAVGGHSFLGELGLDGSVRAVPGTVPLVDAMAGETAVVPVASAPEARLVGRHAVRTVATLAELVEVLRGHEDWTDHPGPTLAAELGPPPDLAEVRGQPVARQALEVCAAGGHHLLLVGPPGAGKTMLSSRLVGLLPPLDDAAARHSVRVRSAAGEPVLAGPAMRRPPFRAPHHTASMVSLVGGGSATMRPGEVSLASGGVLFLDELGEFAPCALEALRQPLEEGVIRVSRAQASVTFPARFLLVAAMNPCPCGEAGAPGRCRCSGAARFRYRRRLSGPLLDRFDLRVDVDRPDVGDLLGGRPGEPTEAVAARVAQARARAAERGVGCNAALPSARLEQLTPLSPGAHDLLDLALRKGRLSARGLDRVRRVALTLADLAGHEGQLEADHVGLALALRSDPAPLDHAGTA